VTPASEGTPEDPDSAAQLVQIAPPHPSTSNRILAQFRRNFPLKTISLPPDDSLSSPARNFIMTGPVFAKYSTPRRWTDFSGRFVVV
jgi:hypothetical protein